MTKLKEHRLSFWLFSLTIAVTIITSAYALARYQNQVLMDEIDLRATTINELVMLYREWMFEQNGIYVKNPNGYHISKVNEFYKKIPPNIMHDLSDKLYRKTVPYTFRIVSSKPISKDNLPDLQEQEVLKNLKTSSGVVKKTVEENGRHKHYLVTPIVFTSECVSCHESDGIKTNDFAALIVKLDVTSYVNHATRNFYTNILIAILSSAIIIYLVYRAIFLRMELTITNYKNLAQLDGLTGIYNHSTFMDQLDFVLKQKTKFFGVIIFDIDDFKQVNDKYGHQAGDYILKEISTMVKEEIREKDIFARYGGEEFALLVFAQEDKVYQIAQRICDKISANLFNYEGQSIKVAISIGIAIYPKDAQIKRKLVKYADDKLYLAKAHGKNGIGNLI